MAVSPRLRKPLSINTNISYAMDPTKFPGLDDPQLKFEPALLIANAVINNDAEIPSPTLDLPDHCEELLDDLLSIIEWEKQAPKAYSSVAEIGYPGDSAHQQRQQKNHQLHQPEQRLPHHYITEPDKVAVTPRHTYNPHMSRYALDVIFNNLIYPEVTKGHLFTLDTLVQSVHGETTPVHQPVPKRRNDVLENYAAQLQRITGNFANVQDIAFHASGKRKRSLDTPYELDNVKRQRCYVYPRNRGNAYGFSSVH